MILWQKKKGDKVLLPTTNHRQLRGKCNTTSHLYNYSISDLVRKVKGKCEIEIFERKMFSVVIMFLVESGKMYKYSKSAGSGANYN